MYKIQELLQLVIFFFILMTSMFDLGVILQGEIRWQSLLGVKGLLPNGTVRSLFWDDDDDDDDFIFSQH